MKAYCTTDFYKEKGIYKYKWYEYNMDKYERLIINGEECSNCSFIYKSVNRYNLIMNLFLKGRIGINGDLKKVEFYLTELVELDILEKKIQYVCPNCSDTTIMNNKLLNELIDEDGYFQCDDCMEFINSKTNITGYVYYDIKNISLLEDW